MQYVIWSFEHSAWWGPNKCGYTSDLASAGRYSIEVAGRIVVSSILQEEVAILLAIAEQNGPPKHPVRWK